MGHLDKYDTFNDLGKDSLESVGCKKIRVNLVYDVKYYRCHKAELVADGHLTDIPFVIVYYRVFPLHCIRLLVCLADINKMETWDTEIGHEYLEAKTLEKVYIISGTEFGDR